MLLAVYGTLRKNCRIGYVLDEIRYNGTCVIATIKGLKICTLGAFPGAHITNNKKDAGVVELIKCNISKEKEHTLLTKLDIIEGVAMGLYKRNFINTVMGKALIYTFCSSLNEYKQIQDWTKFIINKTNIRGM